MLTTHIEKFADTYVEMQSVNLLHYHEVSQHYEHGINLNPDYAKYLEREERGELLTIILREDGKLVGYYIGFIGNALHYLDCLSSQMDIIYVTPDRRGNSGGVLLVNALKAECIRRGVRISTMGCKEEHRKYMEKLLLECGYKPFEVHFALWF